MIIQNQGIFLARDVSKAERVTLRYRNLIFFFCFYCHLTELKEWVLKACSEFLPFSASPPVSLDVSHVFSACCASFSSGISPQFYLAKHSHCDALIYLPHINEVFPFWKESILFVNVVSDWKASSLCR